MAEEDVGDEFRDLLNPIRNLEQSFAVNISEILRNYLAKFLDGHADFNKAALVLQASSSIYGKKVEHLYNLTTTLHDSLTKQNHKKEDTKKKTHKERASRQSKSVDLFCSTDIKPGKNLSCLKRKNFTKSSVNKKSDKKVGNKKFSFVPADLLPLENEEKGDVFYDTCGDPVGNKGDFMLNKCSITSSGWLLLPTVSADNVSDMLLALEDAEWEEENLEDHCGTDAGIPDTPDEGYPVSSGCPSSPPTAPSSQVPSSQESGIGSLTSTPAEAAQSMGHLEGGETPMEGVEMPVDAASSNIENIPMDGLPEPEEVVPARPLRRSTRNILAVRQNQQDQKSNKEEIAVKKPIEKGNTVCLPSKLRGKKRESTRIVPASVFCARTFFDLSDKLLKRDLFSLQVTAFANNSKFLGKIQGFKDRIKASKSKQNKKEGIEEEEDEDEVEVNDLPEPNAEVELVAANPSLGEDDFSVDHEFNVMPALGDENPIADDIPMNEPIASVSAATSDELDEAEAFERSAEREMAKFREELQSYEPSNEISEKVREWQENLTPFLERIKKRSKFDIHEYGSHIINAFGDNDRRQSIIFRDFCKDMEKWKVHRYFMALLPLVNLGNVSLQHEKREGEEDDDNDDLVITLLSRKMHHLELGGFNHNVGEHD